MSLHHTLARSAALQIAGKIVSTLLGFVAIIIMTRSLGAEQFGWYITASSFLQFVGIFSDFGFTLATSNLLAEPAFDKQSLLNTSFSWRLVTALIIQGLAVILFLFFPYPWEIKVAVEIISISIFASTIQQIFIGYYRQKLQLLIPTIADVVARVLLVIGVALAWYTRSGFYGMMFAVTVATVVSTIYLWVTMPRLSIQFDRVISKALFIKMWPTALSIICNSIYLQGDRVILPLYASQVVVGYYGAAYRVVDIMIQLAALIMGMVMPVITHAWSRGDEIALKERSEFGLAMVSLVILPLLVGTFVLAVPIMVFTAGPAFAASGLILKLLSVCVFGICFGMVFGHIVLAINRQREGLWVYFTDALFSAIGYAIFIPRYGWLGAVGVTIFSEWYAGILNTALTLYYTRMRFRWLTFGKICLASALMGVVIFKLSFLPLALVILIGGLIYCWLIIGLRVVSLEAITSFFRRVETIDVVEEV